jgi:hypothetical protein
MTHIRLVTIVGLLAAAALSAVSAVATPGRSRPAALGTPPPELAANASSWPAHNENLANTRANLDTEIDAAQRRDAEAEVDVQAPLCRRLRRVHLEPDRPRRCRLPRGSGFRRLRARREDRRRALGARVQLRHAVGRPERRRLGYGLLFGETEGAVFALDPKTREAGLDPHADRQQPGGDRHGPAALRRQAADLDHPRQLELLLHRRRLRDGLRARRADGQGDLELLDGQGRRRELWGNPKENGGGGLWYPPAVDSSGRVFIGVANPGALSAVRRPTRTRESRPGPEPLHRLARRARRRYRQAALVPAGHTARPSRLRLPGLPDRHDAVDRRQEDRDRDRRRQVGQGRRLPRRRRQAALDAQHRQAQQATSTGRSRRSPSSTAPAPRRRADADGRGRRASSTSPGSTSASKLRHHRARCSRPPTGGLAAVDAATGAILWKHIFKDIDAGAATVATTSSSPPPTTGPSTPSRRRPAPRSGRPRHRPASTRSRPSPKRCSSSAPERSRTRARNPARRSSPTACQAPSRNPTLRTRLPHVRSCVTFRHARQDTASSPRQRSPTDFGATGRRG